MRNFRQIAAYVALGCSTGVASPAVAEPPAWDFEKAILAAKSTCPLYLKGTVWNARLFGDKWEVRGQGTVKGHPAVAIVSIPVARQKPLGCSVQVTSPDRTLIE